MTLDSSNDKLKVFISSKMLELRDAREYLEKALADSGIHAWVYESQAGARPESVEETSLKEVEASDIYVGLFWEKCGPVTIQEYQRARELGKPCFIYIRDKDISREQALEDFLRSEIYDLQKGITYAFFSSAVKLSEQVANDIVSWLVRSHREMTAEIKEAHISKEEIHRLQLEVERLQNISRSPLPEGTAVDYLALQLRAWFKTLNYGFESYHVRDDGFFEWIVRVPKRRGYDRILVRGIEGEAKVNDVADLRLSVTNNNTDEGWLIVVRRKSQAAIDELGKSENKNLVCYTFDELLDVDADFSGYLNWLEAEVKRKGVDELYIPLACSKEEFHPVTKQKTGESRYDRRNGWIDNYIDRWLDDPAKEHISILGEFGTGKTWFTLHYAWVALQKYREAKERGTERPRLPLIIPLRDYAKAVSVESLFSEFFFRKHEIPLPGYSAFEQLNHMGKLLLIFDGFDEMAARIDRQRMINNFWELSRVVVPGSKAILTCRTEHFPDAMEGRALLSAELQASTSNLSGQPPQFEVLELKQFDDEQIQQALSLRASPATVERVIGNNLLLDLARRPVMTELILEALPEVEAGKPVDLSRIYLYAVKRKMERDIKADRTFTSLADKMYFLCELAWEMISTDRMSLNYRLFPDQLRRLFGETVSEQKDLDHWHYDMMGQTMLIRNADGDYMPAHRSLLEFFVAYKFAAQMGALVPDFTEVAVTQASAYVDDTVPARTYTWSDYFQRKFSPTGEVVPRPPLQTFSQDSFIELSKSVGKQPLSPAIQALMKGMLDIQQLYPLVQATREYAPDEVLYTGGNATTLIHYLGGTFENCDLHGVYLKGAILHACNFTQANLFQAKFDEVQIKRARLDGANFSESDLMTAFIWQSWAEGTTFDKVIMGNNNMLIFVGQWVSFLPIGATLLDAAFSVHSEMGWHSTGGTIDGKDVSLDHVLSHGSRVWIHTDRSKYTVADHWPSIVKSYVSRNYIAKFFKRVAAVEDDIYFQLERHIDFDPAAPAVALERDLFQTILFAYFQSERGSKERGSKYRDIFEGELDVQDVVAELLNYLTTYEKLQERLLKTTIISGKFSSYRRFKKFLVKYSLPMKFGVPSPEELIIKMVRDEVEVNDLVHALPTPKWDGM